MSDRTATVELLPRAVGERPLSHIQRQIWTSGRLSPDVPIANMGVLHRIRGEVDPAILTDAFARVVSASDVLRSVVVDRPGRSPRARILAEPPAGTPVIELPRGDLERWARERIAVPIDPTLCAYDSVLLRHHNDDWTWWLDLHHIVTDAAASALVFEVVGEVYAAIESDTPDAADAALGRVTSFYDHVDDTAVERDDPATQHRLSAWDPFQGVERQPIAPAGPRGDRTTRVVRHPVDVYGLERLPKRYRTLSDELSRVTLLAAATAALLHRLDGRDEIVLGLPIHHRSGRVAPNVIGPLMELYPIRVDLAIDRSFGELFDDVHRSVLGVLRNARPGTSPITEFDAIVNVLTAGYGRFAGRRTYAEWVRSEHVEAEHPIRVQSYDYGNGPKIELDLNTGLSIDGAHEALPARFAKLLIAAIANPDTAIGDVDLLSGRDRSVMAALNPPRTEPAAHRPIHLTIRERLRSEPGQVTAEHDRTELTAGELDARADGLARWLAGRGVAVGGRVGIRMRRGLDVLVAVHGVLRAGAAFVMLDPDDPSSRHETIAADAGLALILDTLPSATSVAVGQPVDLPDAGPDDLAYILYTSGSTGAPKGVPISHRGLSDYLDEAAATFTTRAPMVMPLHSSLVFDLTITSLFLPQLVGGRTVVVGGDALSALSAVGGDRRITALKATPSQLEILARIVDGADAPMSLEVVIVGGEAFRRPLAEAIERIAAPGVRVYNEYGPTEAVVGCMLHLWNSERDAGADVPIGTATPGAEVYVLDRYRQATPVGTWGELYVRRPGMATGYLNLPDLSAARFAPVGAVGGGPLYRTGDRVRVEDGVLVYGGRLDDQLKVSGVRLEPGEIEAALLDRPEVSNAIVRVWTPTPTTVRRCVRCGLGTDVPGIALDQSGVCTVCREYERIEPQTRTWFKTLDDLAVARDRARSRRRGTHDCLHLLSGGKDSTYALYQLVNEGWDVHALTLDNGYISDGAKENIRRTVDDLGISHEFVTTDAMAEIFRDSLDRFANVCNGCYKTIYTLAVARAHELGIPVIVTGLSRGQFFETRLVPHQFEQGRFDPDDIDRTVLQARRAYHRTTDAVTESLPEQSIFERSDLDVLDEIEFVDFYRYVDVELAEMYEFLDRRAPWVRPTDTGRSTNCLINVVGIHVHRTERGYHNYAEPYSWDVRLGHKTRDEALDELDDELDAAEIERILDEIEYAPKRPEVLTAWYQTHDGGELDARVLASALRDRLPSTAVPAAFVHVTDIPLAGSAKLDIGSLPAPTRHHQGSADYEEPSTPTAATCAAIWSAVLDLDRVGATDDFFDLGGASLTALETVVATERHFDIELPDALVFEHRVLRDFAAAVDAAIGEGGAVATIAPVDELGPAPLSAGEEALLFEHLAAPADPRYHGTRHYSIDGVIDTTRLRTAVETVIARHDPLRTTFGDDRRRLTPAAALEFVVVTDRDIATSAAEIAQRPYDLVNGPLVRMTVHRTTTGSTTEIVVGLHHITADAGTFDLLWDEIDAAYHDRTLPELPVTYAAHGAWQRPLAAAHLGAWRRLIHRAEAAPAALPTDAPEPDGYLERAIDITTTDLAKAATSTPFATSLAAGALVLGAYRQSERVTLTIAASTKDHPDVEPLIGYFLNTVPVSVEVDATATLGEIDRRASDAVAEVVPLRTLQLGEIVRDARQRDVELPDLSCMIAYERLAAPRFGERQTSMRVVPSGGAVNDVTFLVHERGDTLGAAIEYRGTAIGRSTATRLLREFVRAIETLAERPHRRVDDFLLDSAAPDLAGPDLPIHEPTVVDSIIGWAARTPDADAVVTADGNSLSYAGLIARGRAVATLLHDVERRSGRIGVAIGRSSAMIEAIVGVQLAGLAYVPLDPTVPIERRRAIAHAAGLDAIVGSEPGGSELIDLGPLPRIDPERWRSLDGTRVDRSDASRPHPDDPAYVIFTSGSTGEPAGVEVRHRNLAASTAARGAFYDHRPDRFLLTPSIGFDSSIVGLFWPLVTGGAVVIPDDADVRDVDRLAGVIASTEATHLLMVPSLYRALLARRPEQLGTLRVAIVAGEACAPDIVDAHHVALGGADLVNEYGPTEATVWSSAHRCLPGDDPVPIGAAIAGATLRVADRSQRPLPPGAVGELLISGAGVVDGYLTGRRRDAFVDDGEQRWYRTGDLVRTDGLGRLLFVGRVDGQLNVGGLRLEPSEVERHLLRIDGIEDAVVVAARVQGRESLVAHVVGDAGRVAYADVRDRLAGSLQMGAIPRRVAFHPELPRTVHGKIDRDRAARLPIDDGTAGAAAARSANDPSPADGGTSALVPIWQRALGQPDLDARSDFFASGGDSLAAVEIVTALGELVGRDVPVAALLAAPTPAAMAARLQLTSPPVAPVDADQPPTQPDRAEVRFVTLREGEVDGPTIVIAAAWDDVQAYRALADAFPPEVTVRALAVEDESDEASPLHRVVPLVDAAIDPLIEWWDGQGGRGPLVILGWSVGGIVAQHLGHELVARGRGVHTIALVDTYFPGEDRHIWSNRWWKYKSMLTPDRIGAGWAEFSGLFKRRLQRYAGKIGRSLLRLSGETIETPVVRKTKAGIPFEALDHEPVVSEVPVLLFAARTTNPKRTVHRWRTVAPHLEVVSIEGRHRGYDSVMGADRVGQLVSGVLARLDR